MSYRPKYLGHVNLFVRNVERSRRGVVRDGDIDLPPREGR